MLIFVIVAIHPEMSFIMSLFSSSDNSSSQDSQVYKSTLASGVTSLGWVTSISLLPGLNDVRLLCPNSTKLSSRKFLSRCSLLGFLKVLRQGSTAARRARGQERSVFERFVATPFCLMEYIIINTQEVLKVFKRIVPAWTKSEETVQKEKRPLNPSAGTGREVVETTTQQQSQGQTQAKE